MISRRRLILGGLATFLSTGTAFAGFRIMSNPYYSGPVSDHFDGTRFFVPGSPWSTRPLDLLKWQFDGQKEPWPQSYPSPFADKPPQRSGGLRVTLIGHASFLIQTAGRNILIDPVYGERVSPFQFAGPKRVNPPGIAFDDLPPIDAVLVSHNHYDHMDLPTLHRLNARNKPVFIVPLGNAAIVKTDGMQIEERDWNEVIDIGNGVMVHIEPTYHWSARGLFDRLKALWCSFVIAAPAGKIYSIADTGYREGMISKAIARKHGPIRLALLPIGAYEPRWFMKPQHINPAEAVQIFIDSGAAQAIGHHWGTFRLTNEGIERPLEALAAALAGKNIAADRFQPFRPGQVMDLPVLT
jgi:L-ascorbate metabolism protein UlaG (beta-lactamase superfamily)